MSAPWSSRPSAEATRSRSTACWRSAIPFGPTWRARAGFGIDCLFVTRGIHSEDFEGIDQLDPASVKELFGHPPRALMRELRW